MIKHIVMWKISAENKSQNAMKMKADLEALKNSIQQIGKIEVGININPSDCAYDVVLYSEFDSLEDLQIYQKHPRHMEVADFIAQIRTDRAVVDYETID